MLPFTHTLSSRFNQTVANMKLLVPITAILAAASAGSIYAHQPVENYANSAEAYQSQLEYQQQGLYSDQSQYSGHGGGGHVTHERPIGEKTAKILSYVLESDGHGYQYSYETDNGIKAQEVGQTHHDKGTEAHGAYSYTGDDGQVYTVTYTADEHGFRAEGHHLPTPPPVPEAIAKALEQNAKDEAAGVFDDGKYVEENHHQSNQGYHQAIQGHHQANQGYVQDEGFHHQGNQDFHHQGNQGLHQQLQGHGFQQLHNVQSQGYHQQFQNFHHEFLPSAHLTGSSEYHKH